MTWSPRNRCDEDDDDDLDEATPTNNNQTTPREQSDSNRSNQSSGDHQRAAMMAAEELAQRNKQIAELMRGQEMLSHPALLGHPHPHLAQLHGLLQLKRPAPSHDDENGEQTLSNCWGYNHLQAVKSRHC